MTQITLNIEKPSTLKLVMRLLGVLDGITISKPAKVKKSRLDNAFEEVKQGKLIDAKDAADVMRICKGGFYKLVPTGFIIKGFV